MTTTRTDAFEQIHQQDARLAEMRQQIATLTVENEQLGLQIAQALASGQDATKLRARRAEARQLRADLIEAAAMLEQGLTADREAAGRAEAERRQVGIRRAFGSLLHEYEQKVGRLREQATAFAAAGEAVNETFRALMTLRAEDAALVDRFGLARSELPPVIAPGRHEGVTAAVMGAARFSGRDTGHVSPTTGTNAFGARRRTFEEIKGSPAYEIISQAGLKPFPPPTPAQQADRERQEAASREFAARVEAERPKTIVRTAL